LTTEDLTTYTEVDIPANRIRNITASSVQIYDADLDETAYLYYNFGAGNISGPRVIRYKITLESYAGNGRAMCWTFNNELTDFGNESGPSINTRARHNNVPDEWQMAVIENTSGDVFNGDSYSHGDSDPNTVFYIEVTWDGLDLTMDVYDDAAYTSLLGSVPITLDNASYTFQYCHAVRTDDQALTARAMRFTLEDLDIDYGGASDASANLFAEFDVQTPFEELKAEFLVRNSDEKDLFAQFFRGADASKDLFAEFAIPYHGSAQLFAKALIAHAASENLKAIGVIRNAGSSALKAEFFRGADASKDLFAETTIRKSAVSELFSELSVRHTGEEELKGLIKVTRPGYEELSAYFEVGQDSADFKERALVNAFGFGVRGDRILNYTQGYIFGTKFLTTNKLKVADSIEFFYRKGVLTQYARGAIYTVTGGNYPGTLLEETSLVGPLTGDPDVPYWVSLPFVDKPILQPSTEYFILVWANRAPAARARYTIPDATLKGFQRSMGSGPVGSFTSYDPMIGGVQRTYKFSILSTYDLATDASRDLKAVFHIGEGQLDLFSKFTVKQWQEDLKAEFSVNYGKRNLKAEFSVLNANTLDLFADFKIARSGSADLFNQFIVRKKGSRDLFHKLFLTRPYNDLLAEFIVRHTAIHDLPAEGVIRHTESQDLTAETIIQHSAEKELPAQFIVRYSNTIDLPAEFWIGGSAQLKAIFYLPTRRNKDAYYPIIDDGIKYWLNHLELSGAGFIGWPVFENDNVEKASGTDSLKITSEVVDKGFKEVTFGWLYEPVYLNAIREEPCEGIRRDFVRLIDDNWKGYEEYTIDYTDIEKDNFLRMEYNENFGAGGFYYSDDNYGNLEYYGLSSFEGWLPGEIPSQRHRYYATIAMKWGLDDLGGIDLTRFGWARQEIYRYGKSGSIPGGPIKIYRMPDCKYIDERGSPVVMGGCHSENLAYPHSSTGVYPSGTWTELTSNYRRMGYSQVGFTFNRVHGNNSFYAEPDDGIGFSWENATYDKIDLSTLMLGWLNGTYNNHGMFIFLYPDPPFPIGTDYTYYNFQNELRYYSRESSNDNKPIIRVMLQPSNQKWTFKNKRWWDINTDDPYSGSASLRLKDWSKASYVTHRIGAAHGNRPGLTLNDETPKTGYIETAFRLNSETWTQVEMDWRTSPDDYWLYQEDTPIDNYFNIYLRYQDASNHYRVEFNKAGTSCRIRREVGGAVTTLNTFSGIKVNAWHKIRVYWTINSDGDLKICCYKWDEEQEVWRFLAGAVDADNYWPDGGEVYFESMDGDLDETEVWEEV